MLSGLALSAALAALLLGPWLTDMLRVGLARENYRGRRVAFPAGAPLVACSLIALAPLAVLDDRADLDLLDPELRRWIVYVLGVAMLGLLDDALGRGAADDTPRGWRGHARRVDRELLAEVAWTPDERAQTFVCGPTAFVEAAASALVELGHEAERIKTERFGPTGR